MSDEMKFPMERFIAWFESEPEDSPPDIHDCARWAWSHALASQAARIAELEATNQRLIDSYEHNRECTLAGWKDSREKVAELEAELTKLKGIFKND